MYFPMNFVESLKFNALEFFSRNLAIDTSSKTIQIPQYSNWIDPNFIQNINKYKDCIPKDFFNYVKKTKETKIEESKYDWKMNYENFKNNEIKV